MIYKIEKAKSKDSYFLYKIRNADDIRKLSSNTSKIKLQDHHKWFNKKLGYGFITVYNGEHKGLNIFVHHSCIQPLNSNFKTLKKGEYVSFNVVEGKNGIQATDVKGILGGPLLCDNIDSVSKPKFYEKISQQPSTQEEL